MPKRCLTMPTRCLTKSIRCLTKSIRCLTMVMRCLAKPIRCLTKSIRCLTMVMRCLTKSIRCLTMVTRCLAKHYFISKNTPHKNKTPFLSPPQHILAFNSQNCHFAPSRLLSRFPKTSHFNLTKLIKHSHPSPLFRGEGMGVRSLHPSTILLISTNLVPFSKSAGVVSLQCSFFVRTHIPFLSTMPNSR